MMTILALLSGAVLRTPKVSSGPAASAAREQPSSLSDLNTNTYNKYIEYIFSSMV